MRLLVLQGEKLTSVTGDKLEAAILNGPPRDMFSHDLQSESFQDVVNRLIWLRLVKLREGGKTLGKIASERITELSSNNPDWIVGSHERDEFPHWSSGTGDPDYEKSLDIDFAPRKRRDLVEWLRKSRSHQRPFYEDTWSKVCRIHPLNCFYALYDLAQQAEWPEDRWRTALQIWSDKRLIRRSWQYVAPLLQTMPDHVLLGIIYSVSGWLKSISQVLDGEDAIFVALCGRILALSHEGEDDSDEPLFNAINHPIGHVTEALLNFCFNRGLNDNDKLPNDIESLFTKLCDPAISHYRYSRVILASRLIALFRVDRTWVENHLLPLFDWNSDTLEAKVAWEGFMWSPRLYPPLMIAFKDHFLSTAKHYDELSKHGRQFPSFLTFAALMSIDGYSQLEFRLAIEALPRKGLEEVIRTLVQAAEESSGQREEYWKNRIRPFWQSIWPKSNDLVTETIASLVAKLCITNPEEFPIALFTLIDWLRPIEHPDFIVHKLYESGLPDRFPNESFRFLSTIIDHKSKGARELTQCLDVIARVSPSLKQNSEFNRLRAIDS